MMAAHIRSSARGESGLLSLAAAAAAGLVLGLGSYTFFHAQGYSYFRDDPAACINCHVMRDQYASWSHSSHRTWATCNDCHTPRPWLEHYLTKAINGYNHSVSFTTGDFREPIVIGERNRLIALRSCLACHAAMVSFMRIDLDRPDSLNCIACHGNVGHQRAG